MKEKAEQGKKGTNKMEKNRKHLNSMIQIIILM